MLDFFRKRKLSKEALKFLEEKMKEEVVRQARLNALLKTDNFAEVISELINQANNGAEITITLNSGHKIDIKPAKDRVINSIPRDYEDDSIWGK